MKSREEPMKKQNRVNEEKNRNTQKQETEVITGREKVGEGVIRKVRTQEESTHQTETFWGKRCSKKEGHRIMTEEIDPIKENTFSVLQEEDTEPSLDESSPINEIDKDKKKLNKGNRRGRVRKNPK